MAQLVHALVTKSNNLILIDQTCLMEHREWSNDSDAPFPSSHFFLSFLCWGIERVEEKGQKRLEEGRAHRVAKD